MLSEGLVFWILVLIIAYEWKLKRMSFPLYNLLKMKYKTCKRVQPHIHMKYKRCIEIISICTICGCAIWCVQFVFISFRLSQSIFIFISYYFWFSMCFVILNLWWSLNFDIDNFENRKFLNWNNSQSRTNFNFMRFWIWDIIREENLRNRKPKSRRKTTRKKKQYKFIFIALFSSSSSLQPKRTKETNNKYKFYDF